MTENGVTFSHIVKGKKVFSHTKQKKSDILALVVITEDKLNIRADASWLRSVCSPTKYKCRVSYKCRRPFGILSSLTFNVSLLKDSERQTEQKEGNKLHTAVHSSLNFFSAIPIFKTTLLKKGSFALVPFEYFSAKHF